MPETDGRVTMAVLAVKLDYITAKLDVLADRWEQDHEDLESIKSTIKILKWVGGTVSAIVVTLTIAAIKRALGI